MIRLGMKSYNMIQQRRSKISSSSSRKIDKHEYFTSEELLPSNHTQIIEQTKSAYSPLRKALVQQTEKQVGALKSLDTSNKKRIKTN